jgi:hypothetical protein
LRNWLHNWAPTQPYVFDAFERKASDTSLASISMVAACVEGIARAEEAL